MEVKELERLLALKVMRLKRPSLFTTLPLTSDERDLPGELFNTETQDKIGGVDGLEFCSLGQLLMLPQSFGNIYLGETFSSYISVHNDSKETVHDVFVQVDLQIGSQRIPLSITTCNTTTAELAPEQSVDDIIHHEVKEIGDHVLVFAVSYTTQAEEKMYFRKFFKFQVLKPLDVKTKFYNAESDKVYLEAQVQNITLTPICLQKVALEPSSLFNVVQLNNMDSKETSPSIFGSVDALNPMDSRQYLYCLNPKKETRANQKALKGVTNIGKLDIVWRSNMGEKGRLQTSQLQRMAPGYGDIRFTIEELPHEVIVEEPFTITCRVVNSCERKVNLVLVLDSTCSPGLYWIGLSGHSVGELEPDSHFDLTLQLVPIQLGLQTISGIRLVDTFLKRTYDYDELAQVFVKSPDTPLLENKRSSNDRLT